MNRRAFLKLGLGATGTLITASTMAEAGMWAEFMDWVRRKPVYSFPSNPVYLADSLNAISMKYIVPVLQDNIFKPSPMFYRLVGKDKLTTGELIFPEVLA